MGCALTAFAIALNSALPLICKMIMNNLAIATTTAKAGLLPPELAISGRGEEGMGMRLSSNNLSYSSFFIACTG